MKQIALIVPVTMILSVTCVAQDSVVPTASSYSSEGYGNRAEVFVSGFGLFTSHASGNGITQQVTESGGFSAGYRFRLNSWSALEGRYGFSRDSQKYDVGGTVSSIPTYLSEITGSYVYSFHRIHGIQPFLEGGGGILHLSAGNYGSASSSASNGTNTGMGTGGGTGTGTGNIGPYLLAGQAHIATPVAAPSYSGSSPGIGSQTRPTFSYGGGIDFPFGSHFLFRVEYRGLGYETPDFKQTALGTNAISFISEPSFGVAYHF